MKLYDLQGKGPAGARELHGGEANDIHWGKTFWILEQLRKEDPQVVARYFQTKRRLAPPDKLKQYDVNATVARAEHRPGTGPLPVVQRTRHRGGPGQVAVCPPSVTVFTKWPAGPGGMGTAGKKTHRQGLFTLLDRSCHCSTTTHSPAVPWPTVRNRQPIPGDGKHARLITWNRVEQMLRWALGGVSRPCRIG